MPAFHLTRARLTASRRSSRTTPFSPATPVRRRRTRRKGGWMRRHLLALLGVALVAWMGTSVAQAADSPDLRTIGIDVYPVFGQNQPASIGDFSGRVGQALFSTGSGRGFVH